jgi:hypothetical protein
MAYEYKEPDVVERRTVVDGTDSSAGLAIVIVLAVIVVLGLIGYFAFWNTAPATTTPSSTTIIHDGRTPDVNIGQPNVNVAPPSVNVQPPSVNNNTTVQPPSTTGGTTGSTAGTTPGTTGQ